MKFYTYKTVLQSSNIIGINYSYIFHKMLHCGII